MARAAEYLQSTQSKKAAVRNAEIKCRERLGGLLRYYHRGADLTRSRIAWRASSSEQAEPVRPHAAAENRLVCDQNSSPFAARNDRHNNLTLRVSDILLRGAYSACVRCSDPSSGTTLIDSTKINTSSNTRKSRGDTACLSVSLCGGSDLSPVGSYRDNTCATIAPV